jgi:hypothetical protein
VPSLTCCMQLHSTPQALWFAGGVPRPATPPQPQKALGLWCIPSRHVPTSPPYRAPGLRVHDTQAAGEVKTAP